MLGIVGEPLLEGAVFLGASSGKGKMESLYCAGSGQYFLFRSLDPRKGTFNRCAQELHGKGPEVRLRIIPLKGEKAARKWAECLSVERYRELFPDVEEA